MKRFLLAITTIIIIFTIAVSCIACSHDTFESITGIRRYDDISKIVIRKNVNIEDGHATSCVVKEFSKVKDILAIYNVLSSAKYDSHDSDDKLPIYVINIYIKGKRGYIRYDFDRAFHKAGGYNGRLHEGKVNMHDSHRAIVKIDEIFSR